MTTLHSSQKPKTTNTKTNNKKTRKRKIIWFNPPYCLSVKTNVGKVFLKFIKKHFPKGNSLNKIFNKNTVKIVIAVWATFHPSFHQEYFESSFKYKIWL